MVQRLSLQSAGQIGSSTHCVYRWCGAVSLLLFMLVGSAAAVAPEPVATPAISAPWQLAPPAMPNGTLFPWVTPSGNPVSWNATDWQVSLYDQMILAFSRPSRLINLWATCCSPSTVSRQVAITAANWT